MTSDDPLVQLQAALGDGRVRAVLANLPGGEGFLAALGASPPDVAALKSFLKDQVAPDSITAAGALDDHDRAALDRLRGVLVGFAGAVERAQAALAAEAHARAADNFQQTFAAGARALSAAETLRYFSTVRQFIDGDAELRVALRKLPEGAAFLQALGANDVSALQQAINRRLHTQALVSDGQYGPGTHDALLSYLGVARLVLEHAADGPAALKAELQLEFDTLLGLGGLRRIPTDEKLAAHLDAVTAALDAAPDFKRFLAALPQGQRIIDALAHHDALDLNRIFGTGDPNDPARSGYDFATHSALGLYLENAKQRAAQAAVQKRNDAQATGAADAARRRAFSEQLGVPAGQAATSAAAAAYLRAVGERLRGSIELQIKMDLRFANARSLGEALKAGSVDHVQAFLKANGYDLPAGSAGKMDLATFAALEQLVDDMKSSLAPAPTVPRESVGTDEGRLNASLQGKTFFVSYSVQLDQKRSLALKAGVGQYGMDSAELWFNQQEENKRYTAALRADFLERTFAGKFESEGHRDIGNGFSHEWEYQVGFAVLQGMYSAALENRAAATGTAPDGTPTFEPTRSVPGYTYDTALLVAGGRYGIGFDRTWTISDTPEKKLVIGFNWHADIGAHISYELYHPPGNDLTLSANQSHVTFTDISYLLSMSELHARGTANFTIDGRSRGVSFQGLAHWDSRIGVDDPTLGFTHAHNLAAALDLGFLNDRIAVHMGVNVPIYPSTFDPLLANPLGTVGVQLKPSDEFSLGGSVAFNLLDGGLAHATADITYTPSRLFGINTEGYLFIKGSYDYGPGAGGAAAAQTAMLSIGINLDGSPGSVTPSSSVDDAYQNPVTRPLETPPERTPRAASDKTTYTSITCSADLLNAIRPQLDALHAQAKTAYDAGNAALEQKKADEAMALLNTPALVSAACNPGDGIAAYQYHVDEPSKFTPADFFAKGYGVCAEFHTFAAAALRLHHYQAYPIEFFAPGRSHVICAFRDEDQKWQILEYGQIHRTEAASAEAALQAFEPGVMKYKIFEPEGGRSRVVDQGTSSLVSSLQDFFDRAWI